MNCIMHLIMVLSTLYIMCRLSNIEMFSLIIKFISNQKLLWQRKISTHIWMLIDPVNISKLTFVKIST